MRGTSPSGKRFAAFKSGPQHTGHCMLQLLLLLKDPDLYPGEVGFIGLLQKVPCFI